MPENDVSGEMQELRRLNRELLEKVAFYWNQLARNESSLVEVVLTLDEKSRFELRPGVDFDSTLAATMDRMFSGAQRQLRVAIPYVTAGGFADFVSMLGEAIKTPSEIHLMFRHPNRGRDDALHAKIQRHFSQEIAMRKLVIKYLGDEGGSGLHAKVVIRDDEEALVSSANWTGYSLSSNAEAGLLTRSKRAVRFLVRWFDFSFENATPWKAILESWGSGEPI